MSASTNGLIERLLPILRREVGESEREVASLHLLDWAASAHAGCSTPEGRALIGRTLPMALGRATAIGAGMREPDRAAFLNSGLAAALEADSTHRIAKVHPGPIVIAAVLAVAEEVGARGRAVLDAIVRGYEAMVRIGEVVGPAHYAVWHSTSTCGPFGSVAGVASILQLPDKELLDALGNAGSNTGGLWQCRLEQTGSKAIHFGRAAATGLEVVDLARRGVTGPRRIFEGDAGFFRGMCPDPDPEAIDRPSESQWKITETSLKPWPGCRHVHPAMDAALQLRRQVSNSDVQAARSITVEVYDEAIAFADCVDPQTEKDALFSLQHAVAIALTRERPTFEDFSPAALADHELGEIRSKVRIVSNGELTAAYPQHWGASVTLDGNYQRGSYSCTDTKGDPGRAMTKEDVASKMSALLGAGSGSKGGDVEQLFQASAGLVVDASMASFTELLQRHRPAS